MNDQSLDDKALKEWNEDVETQAQLEAWYAKFRSAVETRKAQLRPAKWWHRFVPFVIEIKKR